MRQILFIVCLNTLFFFASCSSLDSDAEQAANLSKKSIEYTTKMEFDKAEQAYSKSQELFRKYEQTGQEAEFTKAYNNYLRRNK